MKILLVGNYSPDCQESMTRFAAMLHRGAIEHGHEVRTLRPPLRLARVDAVPYGNKWLGYIDKFILFVPELRAAANWADLVHICDHSNSFYLHVVRKKPHLITCHDLLAVRSARSETGMPVTRRAGRLFQYLISRSLSTAKHIACVSEATAHDVRRLKIAPDTRSSMIYNGLNYPFKPLSFESARRILRPLGIDPGDPFILHVGGNQWYKNRLGVLHIFEQLHRGNAGKDLRLVMAGKPFTPEMRGFISDHQLSAVVLEKTEVSTSALQALYSTARALLFPSLQEGFGWPIIEAQACGCQVVTSDRAPMNEIGGRAAIYTGPENLEEAAAAVELALAIGNERRESSLSNSAHFNTNRMIDAYMSLYVALAASDRDSGAMSTTRPSIQEADLSAATRE